MMYDNPGERKNMKHRIFSALGAAALLACSAFSGGPLAQQKQIWKATDVHPLGYPTVEAIVRMGTKLEKSTNGRISIQMNPSIPLRGKKEMFEHWQADA